MRYIKIPKTDYIVSGFCMGAAGFGSTVGAQDSYRVMDRFLELGGNFLDTAHIYADWIPNVEKSASEKNIGRWLKSRNAYDKVIVATKGGSLNPKTKIPSMSHEELASQLEQSRVNLGIDTIQLYYLHRDDPRRTIEEIMDYLFMAQDKGKIRHIACSNWTAERIRLANEYAEKCGKEGFVAVSNRWSLAMPTPGTSSDKTMVDMDDDLFDLHNETGIAAIPFSSTAQGYITKYLAGKKFSDDYKKCYGSDRNNEIAERAAVLAKEKGITVAQIALAYFYYQNFASIPITSFSNEEQMVEAVAATDVVLTDDEYKFLMGEYM